MRVLEGNEQAFGSLWRQKGGLQFLNSGLSWPSSWAGTLQFLCCAPRRLSSCSEFALVFPDTSFGFSSVKTVSGALADCSLSCASLAVWVTVFHSIMFPPLSQNGVRAGPEL